MAEFPASFFPEPKGELSGPLVEVAIEDVTASLHREAGGAVWLRVKYEDTVLFEELHSSPLTTGRTKEGGPFFLVGSWAKLPVDVRRVSVEHGGGWFEPSLSDEGWLFLLPSSSRGPIRVVWLDEEGRERESTGDGPFLEDSGTIGPTFYVPLADD